MLRNMGWTGGGMGMCGQGIEKPVEVAPRPRRYAGLGSSFALHAAMDGTTDGRQWEYVGRNHRLQARHRPEYSASFSLPTRNTFAKLGTAQKDVPEVCVLTDEYDPDISSWVTGDLEF